MPWFYFSFADATLPKGSQFLGGCYVQVPEDEATITLARINVALRRGVAPEDVDGDAVQLAAALAESHRLGINPGGEVQTIGPLPQEAIDQNVAAADRHRLLTREEIR